MSTLKCKMCGGTLDVADNSTIAECEYCGSVQTLPKLDDIKKIALFDRANHYRSLSEFDKASVVYENIINEEPDDAEAHWGIVLCRYGIEYVEDSKTKKRIPTCHRTQFKSILEDDDYLVAIKNADILARDIYQNEAQYIDTVQKNILSISSKEEPFDIFICYKETDKDGERTNDSVIAQEIYTELSKEGYKVFFARITLEDKIGTAYEPYIFAALTSAKVMLVIGTKPEYFNAVWVKNEWSRYLSFIEQGQDKALVPCYRDMDAYDLPEEFVTLQGQDVSKIGWKQDLVRGVSKLVNPSSKNANTNSVSNEVKATIDSYLKRVEIFLEDGDWSNADLYCEKVLDSDPENANAYVYKMLAEMQLSNLQSLDNYIGAFDNLLNYKKACRYADENLKNFLESANAVATKRKQDNDIDMAYNSACLRMNRVYTESELSRVAHEFDLLKNYKDSKEKAKECREKAKFARDNELYAKAKKKMNEGTIDAYKTAIKMFQQNPSWRDSEQQIEICQTRIQTIRQSEENARIERENWNNTVKKQEKKKIKQRRFKKGVVFLLILLVVTIVSFCVMFGTSIVEYVKAQKIVESGNTIEAYKLFYSISSYNKYGESGIPMFFLPTTPDEHLEKILEANPNFAFENLDNDIPILWGTYEVDGDTRLIEWRSFENKDNQLLLISDHSIAKKAFDENSSDGDTVTWEHSTIRQWLNNEFINNSFSENQREHIMSTRIETSDSNFGIDGGNNTNDYVFLLSGEETEKYYSDYEGGLYWLRTPGEKNAYIAYGDPNGWVSWRESGELCNAELEIRPALWVDISTSN